MTRSIPVRPALAALFSGVLACAAFAAPASETAAPACTTPPPAQQVVEHFLSADCLSCWQAGDAASGNADAGTLRLDWIVPGADGDAAPLATAALPEAAERWHEPLPADHDAERAHALPPLPAGAHLRVLSGLAWNGYIGLSFDLTPANTAWPDDARGWIALVERVPAGQDGTPVARQLVRALVGPLTLDVPPGEPRLLHLYAVRLPANAQVERLAAVGWIERGDGQFALAAQSATGTCPLGQ
jgi:hypothetical protein